MSGRLPSGIHDHVLRYQSCGKTWISAGSGPRLQTVILISTSIGVAFAYSTNASKYRHLARHIATDPEQSKRIRELELEQKLRAIDEQAARQAEF